MQRQCHLQIPTAVILQQIQIPANFQSGEIFIDGQLKLEQRVGFYCPFFLRNIKSHFFHNILPENSTHIDDYTLPSIRKRLHNNPAYMNFDAQTLHWNRLQNDEITLIINLNVDELITRYHVSYWQNLGQIWIQYLSIFIVILYAIDKLKNYIFTEQIIKAWEIIPWKKIY